jgi:hypothetical protein
MFGTFQPELQRPTYGLTKPVDTYNLIRLEYGDYAAIARKVRAAQGWRERLGYLFGPPGWAPTADPAGELRRRDRARPSGPCGAR